jgi:electron transfer flavoprotein alpha subunit
MSKVLTVIPLAWGDEAVDSALAAAQRTAGEDGFAVVLLGGTEAAPHILKMVAMAGAYQALQALHSGLIDNQEPASLSVAAGEVLPAIAGFADGVSLVLLPPGPLGEELCALLADQFCGAALGRCVELRWEGARLLAERAAWGGRMRVSLQVSAGPAFACLRAGKPTLQGLRPVEWRTQLLQGQLPQALTLANRETGQRLPPLDGARLVVSGGRAVNEKGFALLEELAVALDGTLGGSLPAVDAGMVPVMRQVGISGKFVSPDIYLAVGISGTPQHLAGISPDSRIVAVNKDVEADIFKVATLGVLSSWEELLPALLAELRDA